MLLIRAGEIPKLREVKYIPPEPFNDEEEDYYLENEGVEQQEHEGSIEIGQEDLEIDLEDFEDYETGIENFQGGNIVEQNSNAAQITQNEDLMIISENDMESGSQGFSSMIDEEENQLPQQQYSEIPGWQDDGQINDDNLED